MPTLCPQTSVHYLGRGHFPPVKRRKPASIRKKVKGDCCRRDTNLTCRLCFLSRVQPHQGCIGPYSSLCCLAAVPVLSLLCPASVPLRENKTTHDVQPCQPHSKTCFGASLALHAKNEWGQHARQGSVRALVFRSFERKINGFC
jgi:hypothetical protein